MLAKLSLTERCLAGTDFYIELDNFYCQLVLLFSWYFNVFGVRKRYIIKTAREF